MQRIGVLNGNNITYDHDISGLVRGLTDGGVIEGGEISGGKVQPVQAVIACQRSNGQKFMLYFESDEQVAIPSSGTFKVYIEVNQAKIDDGSENAENGTGIASIKTGPSVPSQNTLLLASVADGQITDERNLIPKVQSLATRTTELEQTLEKTEEKIGQVQSTIQEIGKVANLSVDLMPAEPIKKKVLRNIFTYIAPNSTPEIRGGKFWMQEYSFTGEITEEFVYFSILAKRVKTGKTTATIRIGTHKSYGQFEPGYFETTQEIDLKGQIDEIVVKVPKEKVNKRGAIRINFTDETLFNAVVFYKSGWNGTYFGDYSQAGDKVLGLTISQVCPTPLNIIGLVSGGWGASGKGNIGVSLDESEGLQNIPLPTEVMGEVSGYKKAPIMARKISVKNQNILKKLILKGYLDQVEGNIGVSIYGVDVFGNIDHGRKIREKEVAHTEFPLGIGKVKHSFSSSTFFTGTAHTDGVVEVKAVAKEHNLSIYVRFGNTDTVYAEKLLINGKYHYTIKKKITAGTQFTIGGNTSIAYDSFNATIGKPERVVIPADLTLEKNKDYYVVVNGNLNLSFCEGKTLSPYSNSQGVSVFGTFVPGDMEASFIELYGRQIFAYMIIEKLPTGSSSSEIFYKEYVMHHLGYPSNSSTQKTVDFRISTQGRLAMNSSSDWQGKDVSMKYKEFWSSSTSLSALTVGYGNLDIGAEFDHSEVPLINVILNGGILELEEAEFIPGEVYSISNGQLILRSENNNAPTIGIAITPTKLLIRLSTALKLEAQYGEMPLGNAIGFINIDGWNVPAYG